MRFLRLGVDALRLLGRPAHQSHRSARTFFRHDEDSVRELGKMRHDRAAYILDRLLELNNIEGVLTASLAYHHFESEPDARVLTGE